LRLFGVGIVGPGLVGSIGSSGVLAAAGMGTSGINWRQLVRGLLRARESTSVHDHRSTRAPRSWRIFPCIWGEFENSTSSVAIGTVALREGQSCEGGEA